MARAVVNTYLISNEDDVDLVAYFLATNSMRVLNQPPYNCKTTLNHLHPTALRLCCNPERETRT